MAGKRTHQDAVGAPASSAEASRVSKRAKSDKKKTSNDDDDRMALTLLLENADELIDCLRCLKSEESQRGGQSASVSAAKEKLSSLSSKLLPAFQTFGGQSAGQAIAPPAAPKTEASMSVPHPGFITKWTSADTSKTIPPLPAILDPELEKAALTHSGQHTVGVNYERLEWVGDAYLEVIATALVHQTFSDLQEGRCAQLRELLVRNLTLSGFSKMYGLEKRANLPEEFKAGGRVKGTSASDKQRIKALGDLFEAYVGAVILSDPKDGVQRVADWLKVLWGPTLEKQIQQEETKGPVDNISSKTKLEVLIGIKGVKIEYKDLPSQKKDKDTNLPLFAVACVLNGYGENKQLGFGTALGKKEAGQKAAQMALDNKKLLKPYIDKKQAYVAARKAQQAAEEAAAA
ncbi:ribonuclease III domain-containing protein [Cercophora newfieldiana]|uniref:Ribonuclease III domain-containing protein n=1 Tax=Cercophora newfieldiana TaxID=92897 RepID=A0AA39YEU9_9PEZI|nr:ribonuclease III domain-containing protein [Cercophora newfieldiana]